MTDYKKASLDFADFCLEKWIANDKSFLLFLGENEPMRYCLTECYKVMVELEQLPRYNSAKAANDIDILNAIDRAKSVYKFADEDFIDKIARCLLVIATRAEKRLTETKQKEPCIF